MTLRVLSVCTGIGADAVAWSPLGWQHVAFAEIAPFPSRVLAHHWPSIPNLGDFTRISDEQAPPGSVDVLVGGTPCQDFSCAGLRAGLAGENGALALEYLRLAARVRPRWIVWENVPDVMSSDGGRAFGALLGGLAELGYGFAWRVLDAQFFGLAQRRRRVFVVGCAGGSWQRAAAVLLERSGLRWDPAPRREAGAHAAGALTRGASTGGGWRAGPDEAAAAHLVAGPLKATEGKSGPGVDGASAGHLVPQLANTITTREGQRQEPSAETYIAAVQESQQGVTVRDVAGTLRADAPGSQPCGTLVMEHVAAPLTTKPYADNEAQHTKLVVHSIQEPGCGTRAQGGVGVGRDGAPMYTLVREHAHGVALIPFDTAQITHPENRAKCEPGAPALSLTRRGAVPAIAFHQTQDPIDAEELSPALGRTSIGMGAMHGATVRRLTPRECERLQGFPDDYTAIPVGKRGQLAKDGPRYAALGNAIAVPVLRWIGERIAIVEAIGGEGPEEDDRC